MSLDGVFAFHILPANAPALTKERFLHIFEQYIILHCNPYPQPRSVIILDNASVHPMVELQHLCSQYGVLLYALQPYSYDFNPIELAFHQAKKICQSTL